MSNLFDAYAAYYDLLYHKKDYQSEVEYLKKILNKKNIPNGSILEFGCGTGRHAHQFAKKGFHVHGIDLSKKMIDKAIEYSPKNISNQLFFEIGDIRNFYIDKKFDVVLALFHVASYMTTNEDLINMFHTAAKHLKSGGIFIFDFWYGPGVLTSPPSVRVKRLENEKIFVLRIAEPELYANENLVKVNYNVQVKGGKNKEILEINEIHKMRYLFIPEIKQLSSDWFKVDSSYAWMKNKKPNFRDWTAVSILERK